VVIADWLRLGISTPHGRSDKADSGVVLDTAALYETRDRHGDTPGALLRTNVTRRDCERGEA